MTGQLRVADIPSLHHMAWQPIVHFASQQIWGYEALARFTDVTPTQAFAQCAGEDAVRRLDAQCWQQALHHPPDQGWLFLNVTAATIRAAQWAPVPGSLQERVIWELPETAGWDPGMIPQGLPVALDDVGSGYGDLWRLQGVRWRAIKIDRGIIAQMETRAAAQYLVRALVRVAQRRGGVLIAEGVETAATARRLQQLGVAYGQGYLWGMP
ncbi:EAL domain-containing protein [Sulfobacillus thermosulfidooxidans]|uniref:EAL domain-containing protein n=1 Tax=Sulfobacillus thermosulfidooxidans TaxID=28034 RepID=UPI0002D4C371|nr:EAL domain-containing protein [Sulfobacillus thermosulfidooxidans]